MNTMSDRIRNVGCCRWTSRCVSDCWVRGCNGVAPRLMVRGLKWVPVVLLSDHRPADLERKSTFHFLKIAGFPVMSAVWVVLLNELIEGVKPGGAAENLKVRNKSKCSLKLVRQKLAAMQFWSL